MAILTPIRRHLPGTPAWAGQSALALLLAAACVTCRAAAGGSPSSEARAFPPAEVTSAQTPNPEQTGDARARSPARADLTELEAELARVRRATILSHEQHLALEARVNTIAQSVPPPRPVKVERLLVELEASRDAMATQTRRNATRLSQLSQELQASRERIATAEDSETFDLSADDGFIARTREREPSASDGFSSLLDETTLLVDAEGENIGHARDFLFDADERALYIARVDQVIDETNQRIDAVYEQWRLQSQSGIFGVLSAPPPPPPGYEERERERRKQAAEGTGQPVFEAGQGGQSEEANNRQAAKELRKMAEETEDPELKQIYEEEARRLEEAAR